MRFKFFTVPVFDPEASERELNVFLARHRILNVERALVDGTSGACWSVCVGYLQAASGDEPAATTKPKVDYREVLSPSDFEVYADMRRWRKETAAADGVPPYQLFTNEQLAGIVQQRITSAEDLARLPGVGPARIAKYGQALLERFCDRIVGLNQSRKGEDAEDDDTARKRG